MSGDLSVIMPVWNCAAYIEDAVTSVFEKADGLLELIVIDDGSTDGSAEIAEQLGARVIRHEHLGPSPARNVGLREARGDLIGFLDADDIWFADAPDPRRVVIADGADVAMGKLQAIAGDPPKPFRSPTPSVQLGSLIARRDAIEGHMFDESLTHAEDVDWVMRLREAGLKFAMLDEMVVYYRLRHGSLTRDREANRPALANALHASLVRRGKMGKGE